MNMVLIVMPTLLNVLALSGAITSRTTGVTPP